MLSGSNDLLELRSISLIQVLTDCIPLRCQSYRSAVDNLGHISRHTPGPIRYQFNTAATHGDEESLLVAPSYDSFKSLRAINYH